MDFKYWIANGHFFVNDLCKKDLTPIPGSFPSLDLSTIVGDAELQEEHSKNLLPIRHPKYAVNLLCINMTFLDDKNWNTSLDVRCFECGKTYSITREMYESEKKKLENGHI